MNFLARVIFFISILLTLFSVYLFINPSLFSSVNKNLNEVNNLIPYLSLFFSVLALFVASFAFLVSIKKPKLELKIFSWDGFGRGPGDGPALKLEKGTNLVSIYRPDSAWRIYLFNNGEVAAKYPVVQIRFKEIYFLGDTFPGWKPVRHSHGEGWYIFQWMPEERTVVHPFFPIELPTLDFWGSSFKEEAREIEVTIVADGFKAKTNKHEIKTEYIESEKLEQ